MSTIGVTYYNCRYGHCNKWRLLLTIQKIIKHDIEVCVVSLNYGTYIIW